MFRSLVATIALASIPSFVLADGIYTKNSPVIQVDGKSFRSLIELSNHTSIVEFYAPWCGHCQNLKPAYEKAAKNLAGLAKVAAVNCDEDSNKGLCGQMGVKGFPTLKIVRPGTKPGRPVVEDYQGARSAKAIVDAVVDKIPNHVKKVQDSGLEAWLNDRTTPAKTILFTDKGTTSPLIRSLAIDFLGSISFAQIRAKEKAAVDKYGVSKFPTVVLLPAQDVEPVIYDGELKKEALVKFFSQISPPNPDPAPKKVKSSPSKSSTKAGKSASSAFSKASEAHKASDFDDYMQKSGTMVTDDAPTESPLPIVEQEQKPMVVEDVVQPIEEVTDGSKLVSTCLTPKSSTCVLVLLPRIDTELILPDDVAQGLASFAEVADKHRKRSSNIFPIFSVPPDSEFAGMARRLLELPADTVEVLAVNMKRAWWRKYQTESFDVHSAEAFVDAIKLGDGPREKIPKEFLSSAASWVETEAAPSATSTIKSETAAVTPDAAPASEAEAEAGANGHDEL